MISQFDMILKRQSIRKYKIKQPFTLLELNEIERAISHLTPLISDIKVSHKIMKTSETNCKWNGEYCILIYSEKKENYLLNIGYMFEQLDLYFASQSIGACWYGVGKTSEKSYNDLDYVIMINFGKCTQGDFRQTLTNVKRKQVSEIWKGETVNEVMEVARYAPSSCNSQPWRVKVENSVITVFRLVKISSLVSMFLLDFFNIIDMGIFIYILEQSLLHFNYKFSLEILVEDNSLTLIPVAKYKLL